jgi:4-hydroxyacetophenone monooxygenase
MSHPIECSPEWTDEHLAHVAAHAELPALLATLAHINNDPNYMPDSLRPSTTLTPGAIPPQGGMDRAQQTAAVELAIAGLRRFRGNGFEVAQEPDSDRLSTLMAFLTGGAASDYLSLMRRELDIPHDGDAPVWSKAEYDSGRPFRVAIIGAGMSGLAAAHRLDQAGIDYVVFEKNEDVGGTWFENKYPGCRLDTNNFAYSYSFAQTHKWGQHYSLRASVLSYFQEVAERLDLKSAIEFSTRVVSMNYSSHKGAWTAVIEKAGGSREEHEFQAIISAVGQLNKPLIPNIPGLETFAGPVMHTAQWQDDIRLEGKRVGVIGTGASAFQVIPAIAPEVAELTVFQRNAPWMYPTPNYHEEISSELRWLFEHVPYYHRWFRFFQFWVSVEGRRKYIAVDPAWQKEGSVSSLNEQMRQELTSYLLEQFADRPDLLGSVVPSYPPGAKRLLRDDGTWASTLKRPNVSLKTSGITRVTPEGLELDSGEAVQLDVLVLGTGFRASEFLGEISVTVDDALDLQDYWNGEARAYLGIMIPKFPNLFCVYGPNTNLVVNGSIVLFSELAVDYAIDAIHLLLKNGAADVQITEQAFNDYNSRIDAENLRMAWGVPGVKSWYKNKHGRVSQNWPFPLLDYWLLTRHVNPDDIELRYSVQNHEQSERVHEVAR